MAVLSCELVWLAWWQLPFDTVVFKYRLVTALVPVTSDSRILSPKYIEEKKHPSNQHVI
jgi:hypothetical protein